MIGYFLLNLMCSFSRLYSELSDTLCYSFNRANEFCSFKQDFIISQTHIFSQWRGTVNFSCAHARINKLRNAPALRPPSTLAKFGVCMCVWIAKGHITYLWYSGLVEQLTVASDIDVNLWGCEIAKDIALARPLARSRLRAPAQCCRTRATYINQSPIIITRRI